MSNILNLFNTAKSSLRAQQTSLEIVGHNIANANTPGYSKQRVDMETAAPVKYAEGFIGTGVEASKITRVQDTLLESQYNSVLQEFGRWETKSQFLQKVETVLNEPNEGEISTLIGDFFNEWYNLANNPEDLSMRTSLISSTALLTNRINLIYGQFKNIQATIDDKLTSIVTDINRLAKEIGDFNRQIRASESGNIVANDLRDGRDKAIRDLSKLVDINVINQANGFRDVIIAGSSLLVNGKDALPLDLQIDKTDPNNPRATIFSGGINILPQVSQGEIKGLLEVRDNTIPGILTELDDFSVAIISEVNAVHSQGYGLNGNTGINFFEPFTPQTPGSNHRAAELLSLSSEILADPNNIAAGTILSSGDNRNALNIANLQNITVSFSNLRSQTFTGYYAEMASNLAGVSRESKSALEHNTAMEQQIGSFKESVSGVSLDEELSNMVMFQHAYRSAAKFLSTVDSMLDTLITQMGR